MKVIEEHVWHEFACIACKSVCQAEPEDVDSRPNIDCDGDEVGRIFIVQCGKCGKNHDLPSRKVTDKIRAIAKAKLRR